MKLKLILPLLALPVFSGCALFSNPKVPATSITFNPKTDALKITSPKDVTIDSVTISQNAQGMFNMQVMGYKSTNNAALVGLVVNAQSAVASNASQTITALSQMATSAAVNSIK